MTDRAIIVAILILLAIVTGFFFVLFGQVTVKKLRKNPKTKDALGLEYMSGWDILNTAQALAMPRSWSKKLEKSPLSSIHANSTLLLENTTKLDQVLAVIFYWLWVFTGLSTILLVLLNAMGFFQE
ncbi:hypothetical protein SG34_004325 [Thalassomonas viridans]|uniref:Uncharacterized protein n=1 Tax=Thalassomonas viridans TaxID=137584 RepID=A0AAF0CAC9_9GAMM|nr:hypothetical protein [Thalassomonas viridans]WDE06165.1 hypothetical protein SG34_004325 [Thalassomonas viridans]